MYVPCNSMVALCACALLAALSLVEANNETVHAYPVKGGLMTAMFSNGQFLFVNCGFDNASLDVELPHLEGVKHVTRAIFQCPPPRLCYADALHRLGVTLKLGGELKLDLPDGAMVNHTHLVNLEIDELTLSGFIYGRPRPVVHTGLLKGRALRALHLEYVALPPGGLPSLWAPAERSMSTLHTLSVTLASEHDALDWDWALFPALRSLSLSLPLRLLSLSLAQPQILPDWSLFPALHMLSVTGWEEAQPARWTALECGVLKSLRLRATLVEELPGGWLAACTVLETLSLEAQRMSSLPVTLLQGNCAMEAGCTAPALTRLELNGGLRSLPLALFDPVPNLRYLVLSHNYLKTLPGGIFMKMSNLETIDLSYNQFTDTSVYQEVGVLSRLSKLDLSYNWRLGDACASNGWHNSDDSYLRELRNLTELSLSNTNVTRICRDWREGMPRLLQLHLRNTQITRLSFNDLQYERDNATLSHSPGPKVDLLGSPVTTIEYSAEDMFRASMVPPARVEVFLSKPLVCDCESYRALRALRVYPHHAKLGGWLFCAGEVRISDVPLDDLLCPIEVDCPAGCTCWGGEQGKTSAPRWRFRMRCEGAGLTAMPRLPVLEPVEWDLQLARNHISTLDKLPLHLLKLDLRNNSVRTVSERAAGVLSGADSVLLAGNPLACDCTAASLLDAITTLISRGATLDGPGCEDGRALRTVAAKARALCPAGANAGNRLDPSRIHG